MLGQDVGVSLASVTQDDSTGGQNPCHAEGRPAGGLDKVASVGILGGGDRDDPGAFEPSTTRADETWKPGHR